MTDEKRKKIVIIEDDTRLMKVMDRMLSQYSVEIVHAENAADALPLLLPETRKERPDAVILDVMLPYGSIEVKEKLDSNSSDDDEIDTGVNILRYMREQENVNQWPPSWVAITTARCAPHVITDLVKLVDNTGRVLTKPYDDTLLERDLCTVLGLKCKLPDWLLPNEK